MSIFKSCDIRGVYGEELSEREASDIGRGMVSIFRRRLARPRIVVGGDIRRSTGSLKAALIDAMLESGAVVTDVGTLPTPVFYHAFRGIPSDGCAMVTASHNPPKFNGLKLCFSHLPVTEDEIRDLERCVASRDFLSGNGELLHESVERGYERWMRGQFAGMKGMKIVADAGGGCWSELAPRILRRAGFNVVPLFCSVDPDLAVRNPNPLPSNIAELCRTVVEQGCAYGAAFDGDGDRVVFVDELGRPMPSDVTGAIFSQWLLKANPREKIVFEVNCSQALPDVIAGAGGLPLMERAGHAFMKRRMIDERALFGVEISGHFFYRSLDSGDDGLYTAMAMGKLLRDAARPLSELANAVPHYYATPVVRLPRPNAAAREIVDAIAAHTHGGNVSRLDGIRVQYIHGWALARVSVTEPILSMRFEAQRKEFLPEILDLFLGFDSALKDEVKQHLEVKTA